MLDDVNYRVVAILLGICLVIAGADLAIFEDKRTGYSVDTPPQSEVEEYADNRHDLGNYTQLSPELKQFIETAISSSSPQSDGVDYVIPRGSEPSKFSLVNTDM